MTNDPKKKSAAALSKVLADTYMLYTKTHNYHWNVEGPQFRELHIMFEEQYTDMWQALDEIAERIRALGEYAPGTYAKLAKLATIKETEDIPSAAAMVKELAGDNETIAATLAEAIASAQEAGDEPTAGMLTDRQTIHEKQAWMMRAMAA